MRSKTVSLKIPHKLWDAYEKHAREVGYENATQMLIWAPFYSLTVGRPHNITAPISMMKPDAQDAIIDKVVEMYESCVFMHSSLLENVIADVVGKFKLPIDPSAVKTLVAEALRDRKSGEVATAIKENSHKRKKTP